MSALHIPLQPFSNVVATGLALSDLSHLFGYTIKKIVLVLGGTSLTKAMLTTIQLKANGKVIWDSTGSRANLRMSYRGIAAAATHLTIDFSEIKAMTKLAMLAGCLDTSVGIKNLRLEVQITGATAPTLAGYAELALPQVAPEFGLLRPLIARVHTASQTIGAAGTFALSVPHLNPNEGGSIFKRIAVHSANMTGIRVERNGIKELEVTSVADNNFLQGEFGRSAQANLFMADFMLAGLLEDHVLDTRPSANCNTANVFGTFSAGETVAIEVETLEPLGVY